MPHLVILYSNNLDQRCDIKQLCRKLADTMLTIRDEEDLQVFPTGGTRVLAFPAPYYAIADGGAAARSAGQSDDYAFAYLNLRMARGRTEATQKKAGDALMACAKECLGPVFTEQPFGLTFQIDVSPGQVYDGKHSSLHPLFR
jgi:5-carboxymethyl-2-hydroxymuconate isomerase